MALIPMDTKARVFKLQADTEEECVARSVRARARAHTHTHTHTHAAADL